MSISTCRVFAYLVEGRRTWQPWITESTTVLASDPVSAINTASDHHNLRGCRITNVTRR